MPVFSRRCMLAGVAIADSHQPAPPRSLKSDQRRRWTWGDRGPDPSKNHKNIGFLCNTGPES